MKKTVLVFSLALCSLYAQNTVTYGQLNTQKPTTSYDRKNVEKSAISRPNHPSNNLYVTHTGK